MKTDLRNLFILGILLIVGIQKASSQYVVLQYRHVPQENIDEFIHRETHYWSKVAQKAINEGKMVGWSLWQKMGGWDLPEGSNFMFVNVFEKASDMNDMGAVWNPSEVFPGVRASSMSTDHLGKVVHQVVVKGVSGYGEGPSPYIRMNYAKASNLSRYLELEQSVWLPFIKGAIESGKTTQKEWRLAELLAPAGASIPFNAITVDGFDTVGEAIDMTTSMKEEVEYPDLTELNQVHTKDRIIVYGLVQAVDSN